MGRWQKEAMNLAKRHERELRDRPTWLFSSGPTGGTPDSDAVGAHASCADRNRADQGSRRPGQPHRRPRPCHLPGRISNEMTGFLERWMPRGDWRDFAAIEAWAAQIAGQLEPAAA